MLPRLLKTALPEFRQWRRTLTLGKRIKLNHPNAVLRNKPWNVRPLRRRA
jgi:hypothetical protein